MPDCEPGPGKRNTFFLPFLIMVTCPGRKILELLLLGGCFGSDDSKSGGHEHALSVLRGVCVLAQLINSAVHPAAIMLRKRRVVDFIE